MAARLDAEVAREYVCPMHAEVRRDAPGVCPRCNMALVPVDRERLDRYRLDVSVEPPTVPAGRPLTLRLEVLDPVTRARVRDFVVVHERPLHLFLVSEDLTWFDHFHAAQQPDGAFTVGQRLPREGRYQLIADFVPTQGPPQLVQRALTTEGWRGPLTHARLPRRPVLEARDDALTFTLTVPSHAAAILPTPLQIDVRERDGGPARLEPLLGADLHVLAVSDDLLDVVHAHGEASADRPGVIRLEITFPRPVTYVLWAQVQRRGVIHTARFVVPISPIAP